MQKSVELHAHVARSMHGRAGAIARDAMVRQLTRTHTHTLEGRAATSGRIRSDQRTDLLVAAPRPRLLAILSFDVPRPWGPGAFVIMSSSTGPRNAARELMARRAGTRCTCRPARRAAGAVYAASICAALEFESSTIAPRRTAAMTVSCSRR